MRNAQIQMNIMHF